MEIERKFLIRRLPANLEDSPSCRIVQAYLCTDPVVRIRQKGEDYILTLKSSGLMEREEVEVPLPRESFENLLPKCDGVRIEKDRYRIPEKDGLTIELDLFHGCYEGFVMAEVEFPSRETALSYEPPAWFGAEVTKDPDFHNSSLSRRSPEETAAFFEKLSSLL